RHAPRRRHTQSRAAARGRRQHRIPVDREIRRAGARVGVDLSRREREVRDRLSGERGPAHDEHRFRPVPGSRRGDQPAGERARHTDRRGLGSQLAPADRSLHDLQRQGFPPGPERRADHARRGGRTGRSDTQVNRLVPAFPLVAIVFAACSDATSDNRPHNPQTISVLTQHNNNTRSGWNDSETVLNHSNVNVGQFGALFTLNVDDEVYAQPLVVGDVPVGSQPSNVVYIATANNTVYAFDGDDGRLYWQRNFTYSGMRPPRAGDMTGACGGFYN